jgi:hypothetical protein
MVSHTRVVIFVILIDLEITLTKAFLYALTQNRNKFDLVAKEFTSSIYKYGLDCPFPFIRTNLGGHENSR